MSVFVSYRRDDSAGHAGRLCDDLADRLGDDAVFHDVDSIAPGADFLEAIRRAVTSADTVLVVIGPDWATLPNQHGTPRPSEPDDVVRMEIAIALQAGKPTIPVLVGGATMPNETALPEEIAPLARRNAVEVRPTSWDDDTAKLLRALGWKATAPPPAPAPAPAVGRRRRRGRVFVGLVVVGLVAAGVSVILFTDNPETSSSQPPVTSSDGTTTPTSGPGLPVPLALPTNNRTILGGPTEGLVTTVDTASLAPTSDGVNAELAITFELLQSNGTFLDPTDVQLVADGTAINPVQTLGVEIAGRSTEPMTFDFPLAGEPAELVLQVHWGDELAEIPLTGPRTAPAIAPIVVGSIAPADIDTFTFTFDPPVLDTYSDRYLLGIPIHILNNGDYADNVFDTYFRLLIDGDPRAPVNTVNEIVPASASLDTTVWWEILPGAAPSLTLRIQPGDAPVDIPVTP